MKVKRLAQAGQVARVNSDRILTKKFNNKPDGIISEGRPKLRWEDGVKTRKHSFLRRPEAIKDCRANDDDDDQIKKNGMGKARGIY